MSENAVILHLDANSFYASVEVADNPTLRGKPISVCGDPELRKGIVLASSMEAKAQGVKTGMAIGEAKRFCPSLTVLPARMELYEEVSKRIFALCCQYTDYVQPFGKDENFLRLSGAGVTMDTGYKVAGDIRQKVRKTLGITMSAGVSDNMPFAKYGSDYRKPDATTVITRQNCRAYMWPAPSYDLLGVGPSMAAGLAEIDIYRIGEIALAPTQRLTRKFGVIGRRIQQMALGLDDTQVKRYDDVPPPKSIGNSATLPRDAATLNDAKCVLYILAESVAARLREAGRRARCVHIYVRGTDLTPHACQRTLGYSTAVMDDIYQAALQLFRQRYEGGLPYRAFGIAASSLEPDTAPIQLDFLGEAAAREHKLKLDRAKDEIRRRFGNGAIKLGAILFNNDYAHMDPKSVLTASPTSFFAK